MPLNIEHEALTTLLRETRAQSVAALTALDLEAICDPETPWSGAALYAHLALWDEALGALLHAQRGGHSATAPYGDPAARRELNASALQLAAAQPRAALEQRWQRARDDVLAAIDALAFADIHRPLAGPTGSAWIGELVKRLIGHERYHIERLYAAAAKPRPFQSLETDA